MTEHIEIEGQINGFFACRSVLRVADTVPLALHGQVDPEGWAASVDCVNVILGQVNLVRTKFLQIIVAIQVSVFVAVPIAVLVNVMSMLGDDGAEGIGGLIPTLAGAFFILVGLNMTKAFLTAGHDLESPLQEAATELSRRHPGVQFAPVRFPFGRKFLWAIEVSPAPQAPLVVATAVPAEPSDALPAAVVLATVAPEHAAAAAPLHAGMVCPTIVGASLVDALVEAEQRPAEERAAAAARALAVMAALREGGAPHEAELLEEHLAVRAALSFCPTCGAAVGGGRFCSACGHRLEN